jgi:hypothetical protein
MSVVDAPVCHELEYLGAGVGVERAGVVDVEDGFVPDQGGGEAVALDDAGAEVGEEGGRGGEVIFAVALVDFGGGAGTAFACQY